MKYDVYIGNKWLTSGESADLSKEIKYEDFENANYYRHLTILKDSVPPEFIEKAREYKGDKALGIEIGGAKGELERVTEKGLDIRMLNSEFQKMRKGAVE